MAVEILILSGVRRNERITLDSRTFRAGADPSCEVYFDPECDAAVRDRSAKFCLQDGGWYVHCAGGEMYVNQSRVIGTTHLRSGDKIRMSDSGPEFSFQIVAAAQALPVNPPELQVVPPQTPRERPDAMPAQPQPAANSASAPAEATSGLSLASVSHASATSQPAPIEARSGNGRERQPVIWFAGGLAATLLALIVFRWVVFPPQPYRERQSVVPPVPAVKMHSDTIEADVGETAENTGTYACQNGGAVEIVEITASLGDITQNDADRTWRWWYKPDAPLRKNVTITATSNGVSGKCVFAFVVRDAGKKDAGKEAGKHAGKDVDKDIGKDPTEILCSKIRNSVFLVVVEAGDDHCALATCVAIGKHTLLTTANEAAQMANWRQERERVKIWVTRSAANPKFKAEVHEIVVPKPFTMLTEKTSLDVFYSYNVGLLKVKEDLPETVPLASSKELDEIDKGLPLFCFGFSPDGEPVTKYDTCEPRLTNGKVSFILPGKQVLHFETEVPPKNAYGSPLVNKAGRIVGLYGDTIGKGKEGQKPAKSRHYVTIVDPKLIEIGQEDAPDVGIWAPAASDPGTEKAQPPSQP
jgi:hypothetical protein